jgi:hypothetical protein
MGKVLSAQGSGYFPTCILQDDPPADFPSGSIKDFMTFYWRVKKFKVTISGSGTAKANGQSVQMSGTFDLIPRDEIKSESQLVCNLPSIYQGNGGEFVFDGIAKGALFASLFHFPEYYQKSGSSNIQTNISLGAGVSVNYFFFDRGPIGYMKMGSWSINFYGGSLSGELYSPPSSFSSGSFNTKFEATEYWSYGGTWNTSTGEPL